jgi:hypothetical protein
MVHCFQPCQLALDSVYARTTQPPTVKPQLSLVWLSLSRNQHELPEEVRQLLNCELEKNAFVTSRGAFRTDPVGGNQAA